MINWQGNGSLTLFMEQNINLNRVRRVIRFHGCSVLRSLSAKIAE